MVRRLPAISPIMGCPHGTLGLCETSGLGVTIALYGGLFRVHCPDSILCRWRKYSLNRFIEHPSPPYSRTSSGQSQTKLSHYPRVFVQYTAPLCHSSGSCRTTSSGCNLSLDPRSTEVRVSLTMHACGEMTSPWLIKMDAWVTVQMPPDISLSRSTRSHAWERYPSGC